MIRIKISVFTGILSGIIALLFVSCTGQKNKTYLIITKEEEKNSVFDFYSGEGWRYPGRASLLLFDPSKPDNEPVVLTGQFYSASSPDVSYDGKKILFAGKITENDLWQIYQMNLTTRKYSKVISLGDNCTDPLWLPGGRILFGRSSMNDTTGFSHNFYTCLPDGTDLKQITFHPHSDFAPSLLADGRVLFITRRIYPSKSGSLCYVMRPDGTKADKYFTPAKHGTLIGRIRERNDGTIFFIEAEGPDAGKGKLYTLHRNRPLHTRQPCNSFGGNFRAVSISNDGNIFVSFQTGGESTFGIYRYDPSGQNPPDPVYLEENKNLVDVVVAEPHPRQKKLPSEVDYGVKSGQILCQNVNVMGPEMSDGKTGNKKVWKIELLGPGVSYGIVDVENDGSFYLKPFADMPFRIRTIDEKGNVVNGPSGWIWLRPNERRGCVGCHEDPELVPENRVPMAVRKFPVIIPTHVEKIIEKSVDLE